MIIKGNSVGYPLPDPRKGLEMHGGINMNGQALKGLNAPTADDEAANKGYVDGELEKKLSMKLAWENASPASDFAAQTITLSEENDMVVVNYYGMGNVTANMAMIVTKDGGNVNLNCVQIDGDKSYLASRTASLSGKNVVFGDGYFAQAGSGSSGGDNNVCKPTRIYGIKGVSA